MTITLHWWLIPVVLALVGVALILWPYEDNGPFDLTKVFHVIIAIALFAVALAVLIGHWI